MESAPVPWDGLPKSRCFSVLPADSPIDLWTYSILRNLRESSTYLARLCDSFELQKLCKSKNVPCRKVIEVGTDSREPCEPSVPLGTGWWAFEAAWPVRNIRPVDDEWLAPDRKHRLRRAWCIYGRAAFLQDGNGLVKELATGRTFPPICDPSACDCWLGGPWVQRAETIALGTDFCVLEFWGPVLARCIPYPSKKDAGSPEAERAIVKSLLRSSLSLTTERAIRKIPERTELLRWPAANTDSRALNLVRPELLPLDMNGTSTVVMTAFFGDSDTPEIQDRSFGSDCAWLAFTDEERASKRDRLPKSPWVVVVVPKASDNPRRAARDVKHRFHAYVDNCDRAVWIDSTIRLKKSPRLLADAYLQDGAFVGMNEHSELRLRGYFDEATLILKQGIHDAEKIRSQLEEYSALQIPTDIPSPSVETSIFVRDARSEDARRLGDLLMHEIDRFSARDQIGIYGAWHRLGTGVKLPNMMKWRRLNEFAVCKPHAGFEMPIVD